MMTVAVPEGEEAPDIFLLDTRELPWDGSRGATLVREWDGHGMAATQSHAFRYNDVAVGRHAQLGGALKLVPRVLPVIAYMFSSVIMGILDAALAEGRRRLQPRAERMSAFERVSWTKAVNDSGLAEQAFEGMARAIETGAALPNVQRGKLTMWRQDQSRGQLPMSGPSWACSLPHSRRAQHRCPKRDRERQLRRRHLYR